MSAENAKIQYESGQSLVNFVALTDQGDHKDFRSADNFWSNRSGYNPDVKPNGLATGGLVTPAISGGSDKVDVAALTCYLAGIETTVNAAADQTITRPTGGSPLNTHNKSSVTVTSAGAIAIVKGTDGTSWSDTRGAAGGPPWIPTGSIEICQVHLSSAGAGVITDDEIVAIPNSSQEQYNFPAWAEHRFNAENGILGYAGVEFEAALPLIHSDDAGSTTKPKKVYAKYYEPIFTDISKSSDFVPPETSYSVSSKQIYGSAIGATSTSLNQGSFTAYLNDGITDNILKHKGENLFFKFFSDRLKSAYVLCQGILGVTRSFPAGDQITAACTVSSEEAAENVTG